MEQTGPSTFTMTINGRRVQASAGEYVLDVARRVGIHVPTLCDHPAVEPFGSCRLCMVEVTKESWRGWKGLMTACLYPAAEGLIIETDSERVRHVRQSVLDLLLARCPDSELIRRLAAEYGVERTSFEEREHPDLCILCGLCTRVCQRAATSAITTTMRGHDREVGTPWGGPPPDCIGCLACAHICPTGHITFEERGLTRSIWGREFELCRCADCGAPLPITKDQAAFLAERQQMDESYFSRCSDCQRKAVARSMGRIARWNKLGLAQEPSPEPDPRRNAEVVR
jgi:NADH dehydrogenase/NADH:ubiquinone oxidoreductase subunit G